MPEETEPIKPTASVVAVPQGGSASLDVASSEETSAQPSLNPSFTQGYGTGRRKESVARVYLRPGSGTVVVNGRPLERYFPLESLRSLVRQPLDASGTAGLLNVRINVRGGGPSGQAGAARLGVARALLEYDIELRKKLKQLGLLTRDSRVHERKKYGQKGARKRFQFSKR